ncbi:MAG TPA: GNAT family N-acetyltransferase, partial [Rhizomicrobium sp.]
GECFPEAWDEAALAGLIAAPGSFALVAQGAVGFVLVRVALDEAEILSICVSPVARRQGLASSLLQAAGIRATQMGARQMFLEVVTDNVAAKSLYQTHGFHPVGQRKAYYQGIDALVLKADLPLVGNPAKTL